MTTALIGATGFVGSNLLTYQPFDRCFRSTDIDQLPRHEYDHVVCAGMPAEKWRANQHPDDDAASLERLWVPLSATSAQRVTLISTVDVFQAPRHVDEATTPNANHAYGYHRAQLEERVLAHFPAVRVIRLPALYGPGLKKNALFDLLYQRTPYAPGNATFQWYNIQQLHNDILRVWQQQPNVYHLVTEPISMQEIAQRCFPEIQLKTVAEAPIYDIWTQHAALFGQQGHYLQSNEDVLADIHHFARSSPKQESV